MKRMRARPTGRSAARTISECEAIFEAIRLKELSPIRRSLLLMRTCVGAAPLLGLLGTVTGIISTFKLITVFGTGDVKTLSGGISEALITTELGLIAAIPALLLHAYLSRKAKGITDRMEQSALSLVNGVAIGQPDARDAGSDQAGPDASPGGGNDASAAESARDALVELLGPLLEAVRELVETAHRRRALDQVDAVGDVAARPGRGHPLPRLHHPRAAGEAAHVQRRGGRRAVA